MIIFQETAIRPLTSMFIASGRGPDGQITCPQEKLVFAAGANDVEMMKDALAEGASLHACNKQGENIFTQAGAMGAVDAIEFGLFFDIDPQLPASGMMTGLKAAIDYKHPVAALCFLRAGAYPLPHAYEARKASRVSPNCIEPLTDIVQMMDQENNPYNTVAYQKDVWHEVIYQSLKNIFQPENFENSEHLSAVWREQIPEEIKSFRFENGSVAPATLYKECQSKMIGRTLQPGERVKLPPRNTDNVVNIADIRPGAA